uniref:Reticulocyte-binding protein 2 a n=1 Tax=Anthurium amnicola TaxID=1678845 RepID=A0A1D1XSU5_9ARAE
MEAAEGESKKSPDGGEKRPKRKMKTAYQLELLEKTYAVSTYPSESLRVELSVKLGLSDRQLQMWFCHRRLKDRKASEMVASVSGTSPLPEPRKAVARMASPALAKIEAEMSSVKRYYEPMHPPLPPAPTMLELRAITFVESQLGEPIREDGPILGVEFDPLPPGAFGAPIESSGQQKLHGRPYEGKPFERHDPKSIKGPRALHEYQFLPEQPSVRSEGYERIASSHFYDSPVDNMSGRLSPLPTGGPYLHGNEQVGPSYTFQGQTSSAGILPQQGRQHNYPSGSTEYEIIPHKASFTSAGGDALFDSHHIVGIENAYLSSDRTIIREEDATRIERKRKSDEARIAKEVEAHEKRIRRELEKQDVLRRKREEQMRREMERHDRERRKEEERLLREKQREEERFQREQRRENERREKFLQKENRRAEKLRRKEEMRREKEAARIRAAHERATARRIAREYMELIEDERLELMELAASNKGLHSIIFLDSDTLQSLHMFRDMLSAFPPKSVQLLFKKPFAVEPWTDSDENIGNLLMVWRFLITFADVLALWPFTLDEFVQAFHDYDPRLLGEIHMALLKSIIKDIEDVARTPAVALGANQNSAANPGGGHPQIVEGAYAWGFDIRCWQRHLNPLTWPEVLRQFALSAGFGPQLKKSVERAYFRDENEGHDGEDIISTLRNGSAAENAVALMREKGFSRLRRSRHRLTPGTVKFAAFHVLSLEGSKGLTILEVADKIQKSGLRDLTTSKTPEASIAAALSRDSKLFERTAPSTYCVKPQFRKDPADADAVLAAAREKMKVFENGLSDSEEAEKDAEDADEAERDEDSESDGADDLEVDDVVSEEKLPKEDHVNKIKVVKTSDRLYNGQGAALGTGVGMTSRTGSRHLDKSLSSPFEGLIGGSVSGTLNNLSFVTASDNHEASNADQDGTEIDESDSGEPWVQGLMEGEYSDLSVEERLNALVALIGMAIEGNSIRVVLEERLEAANALKKQMWAEAQLDKRRMKEEYMTKLQYSSFVGIRSEAVPSNVITEGSHSPLLNVDNKSGDANLYSAVNNEASDLMPSQNNGMNVAAAERNVSGQEFSVNIDTAPLPQYGYAAEKSRSQLKSYIGHRAEEMYVYRSLPLGQDRRRNRYWQFVTSASRNDPGSGRIFFESKDGLWRLIDSEEAFDALLAALDTRGIRESHLHSMLTKIEMSFKETLRENLHADSLHSSQNIVKKEGGEWALSPQSELGNESPSSIVCCPGSDALDPSMSFRIELGKNDRERNVAMRRYQDFQKWLWKECFNSATLCAMKYGKKRCSELLGICYICYQGYFFEEKHCLTCHKTFKIFHGSDRNFTEHVSRCEKQKADPRWKFHNSELSFPMRVQTLKVQLSLVEACIPLEALQQFWSEGYRKSWGVKLQSSSSADDLLQLLTLLEGALKRDYLSSNYETTNELLSVIMPDYVNNVTLPGSVNVLPWIPQTTAAVGLRLMELDASISYMLHQKVESHKEKAAGEFIKIPSRYAVVKNMQETEISEIQDAINYHQGNWAELGSGHSHARKRGSRGRGGGRGRGRGSRGQRRSFGLIRAEFKEAQVKNGERTTRKPTRRGRTRGRGRNRGRRTVRTRRRSESRVAIGRGTRLRSFGGVSNIIQQHNVEESPRSSAGEEWDGMEAVRAYADEDNSVEPYDSDENGQASSDENSQASSDENGQASGDEYDDPGTEYQVDYVSKSEGLMDDDSEEEDADEDEEGEGDDGDEDMDIDGRDGGEIGDDDVVSRDEGNEEDDEDATSFSSEYSD